MYNLPDITFLYYLFIFIFLSSFTTLTLIFIYSFYTWIVSRRKNVIYKQLYQVDPTSDAYKEALHIVEDARAKSIDIIKEASAEKHSLNATSENISQSLLDKFEDKVTQIETFQEKSIEQVSEAMLSSYKKAIDAKSDETMTTLSESNAILRQTVLEDVDEYAEAINNNTYKLKIELQNKIINEYENARKDINKYRDSSIEELKQKLSVLSMQAFKDILYKSMTQEDHERLILTELDKILNSPDFRNI